MKKVALLADGWRRLVTYSWVDGIMKGAREAGEEICLDYYSTNGTWSHDKKFNDGEYALYDLPDLNTYDGIVFDCTNTISKEQIDHIVSKLKNLKVPVVSIGYDMEGFYYVGNHNKKLFREVLDHLYYKHNCRSFVFAGGPDFHYENKMRFEAFKEAMADYDIPLTDDMYMFGDFDFGTGVRYIKEWHDKKYPLPGAFVCANDNIAAGMCSMAAKLGYKIPQDFMVTGFDNLDKAAYYNPQITTVESNRGNIGKTAIKILSDLWAGKEVKNDHFLISEVIPAESCGCPNTGRVDYRNYIKWQIEYSVKTDGEDEDVMILQNNIEECENYEELCRRFSDYIQTLDCDGIYFVIDKELDDPTIDGQISKREYDTENEIVAFANEKAKGDINVRTVKELKQYMQTIDRSTDYMYCSLHFRDVVVGYTILKNPRFLYSNPAFFDIHSVFIKKLENLYKQKILENTNKKLLELYNKDALTGLYNRVACNEMVVPQYEELKEQNRGCTMMFFDLDDFKFINDTKGHKYGDKVIKKIADIIDGCKPDNALVYRFGGDEFIVFVPEINVEKTDLFLDTVKKLLKNENVNASCGTVYTDPGSGKTFDDYLAIADKKMYECKEANKINKSRGFLKGVDISSILELMDKGAAFFDNKGRNRRVFDILKENNINSVRLRIWNDPASVPEAGGYCDLRHTLDLARVIKNYGMHFVLDFHYSDFWADPGQQKKPAAWEKLDFEQLKKAVYDYTSEVILALKEIGCTPDMVQVGNEIRSGMLFPDGEVPDYKQLAQLVNQGIRAVRDTAPYTEVMIHLDQGGRYYYLKEWFDAMFDAGMEPIDAIGISFYSFWHGTYMDLLDTMKKLIERYKLPVYVVETAHPWRHCENEHVSRELMDTAGLPAGKEQQKQAMQIIMQIAAEASKGTGKTGVYYWEPVCAPGRGFGTWNENMGMFDENCVQLPAWKAIRDFDPKNPPIEDLDSCIRKIYEYDDSPKILSGENLIPNGNFEKGLEGWWISKKPDDVIVRTEDEGLFISSDKNFEFSIEKQIYIKQKGKYRLDVDYRGTNTTGVEIILFISQISSGGEKQKQKNIYPSDVRFVTHSIEEVMLEAGHVKIGIKMHTPPVFGRIARFSLTKS